jgi:hypothetical protein
MESLEKIKQDFINFCNSVKQRNDYELDNKNGFKFINRFIDFNKTNLIELSSNIRKRELVQLRMILSYNLSKNHNMSLERIGEVINRDHSTITYYIKQHSIQTDKIYGNKDYISKFELIEKIKLY